MLTSEPVLEWKKRARGDENMQKRIRTMVKNKDFAVFFEIVSVPRHHRRVLGEVEHGDDVLRRVLSTCNTHTPRRQNERAGNGEGR